MTAVREGWFGSNPKEGTGLLEKINFGCMKNRIPNCVPGDSPEFDIDDMLAK